MDDEIGIFASGERAASDIQRNGVDIIADRANHFYCVMSRVVEGFANLLGIARERSERNVVLRDKIREAMRRGEFNFMPPLL